MKYVYEVVETTNDDIYHTIGLFDDVKFCIELITSACPHSPISGHYDDFETIEVRKRVFNDWGDNDECVFSVKREPVYIEEINETLWKTEILTSKESEL